VQGLIAGAADMLYAGAGTGMVAMSRGATIRMVMSHTPWTDYVFVGLASVKSLKDLAGKPVGTSKIGALNHQAATFAFRQEGVDPNSVQWVSSAGNDAVRAQALVAKTISAAVMNGTFATQAMQADSTLHVVYDVGSVFREQFLSTAVFAQSALIKDKPEVVQAAVLALIESSRALQGDKALAIKQAVSSGLTEKVMTPVYDNIFRASQPYYGVDGGLTDAKVNSTIKILTEAGDIGKPMTAADMVDPRFMEAALKQLGPWKKPATN
jgi:NitT/TauT family transport system substrate-binding protein